MIDIQNPVEMVDFMLKSARKKSARGYDLGTIVLVEVLACDLFGARDRPADAGKTQAPLLIALRTFLRDDLRIEELQRHRDRCVEKRILVLFTALRNLYHAHSFRTSDLLCGKSDSAGLAHRFQHIGGKNAQFLRNRRDWHGFFAQNLLSVFTDLKNHQRPLKTSNPGRPEASRTTIRFVDDVSLFNHRLRNGRYYDLGYLIALLDLEINVGRIEEDYADFTAIT